MSDNGRFLIFLQETLADLKRIDAETAQWKQKHERQQLEHEVKQARWQQEHEERVRLMNNELIQMRIISSRTAQKLAALENRTRRHKEAFVRALRALNPRLSRLESERSK